MLTLLTVAVGCGGDEGQTVITDAGLKRCLLEADLTQPPGPPPAAGHPVPRDLPVQTLEGVTDPFTAVRIPLEAAVAATFYVFESSNAAQEARPGIAAHARRNQGDGISDVNAGRNVVVWYLELPGDDERREIDRCLDRPVRPPPP